MSHDPLTAAVRALLTEYVESVTHLDVLLLVHRGRDRIWTAPEVASELRIGSSWAEEQLAGLVRWSLVVRDGAGYRYSPQHADLAAAVDELAHAYRSHPVAVVTAIYSKPVRKLQNFADAFRLRRDTPEPTGEGGQSNG